jgi:hypothetical protein
VSRSSSPISSSLRPWPYDAAVSNSVPPASTNVESWSRASYSSVSWPHEVVPRANRDTFSPVWPRKRCCMEAEASRGTKAAGY